MKIAILCLINSALIYSMDNKDTILEKIKKINENALTSLNENLVQNDPFFQFKNKHLANFNWFLKNENSIIALEYVWEKIDSLQKNLKQQLLEIIPHSDDDTYVDDFSNWLFKREIEESETHLTIRATLVPESVNNQNK